MIMPTNARAIKIWKEVLEETVGCYEDSVGNRPCDYGTYCNKCHENWVEKIYKQRLKEADKRV